MRDANRHPSRRAAARRLFGPALAAVVPVVLVLAIGIGPTPISPGEVVRILGMGIGRLLRFGLGLGLGGGGAGEGVAVLSPPETIVLLVRVPRALLAAVSGASLAIAGAAFQAVFRNPLADPYILGASSGAALGAAAAVVFGLPGTFLARLGMPIAAFAGGIAAVALAYVLARRAGGGGSALSLLLAGVVVGAWASSLLSLLIYFSGRFLTQIVFWLMGGFGAATWRSLGAVLPYLACGAAIVLSRAKDLNALTMGDDTAMGLGVDAERSRRWLVAGATLLTAACVAVSGPVGFVGLVVPHLVRLAVGANHWFLLPAAAGTGAVLMVIADTIARTVLAPSELPVGIVTALVGGPFFLWLLARRRHSASLGGDGR